MTSSASTPELPERWSKTQVLKNTLIYLVLRVIVAIMQKLPWFCLQILAQLLAPIAYLIASKERQVALKNLEMALPELSPAQRETITRKMFQHLALSVMEIIQIDRFFTTKKPLQLKPEHRKLFEQALAQGQGVIAVTGHIGNWELLAQFLVKEGIPMVTIARPTYDPRLTKWLDTVRSQYGLEVIWRGENSVSREMIRTFRDNKILALLMDQDTRVQSVFAPFFGRMAYTPSAAAVLALRFNAPIILGWSHREENGHEFYFERIDPPATKDQDIAKTELIHLLNQKLESAIRRKPEQWVWLHQRWKTESSNNET